MLVDSHAHIDDPRFDADRPDVLARARAAGVRALLTIGNGRGPDDMGCGLPLAEEHDWIFTSAGVHPHDAAKVEPRHLDLLRTLCAHPKVVAVGETGLDYFYDNSPREVQKEVFARQLEIAQEADKPVIIHTRDAEDDTLSILRRHCPRSGVFHCFSGSEWLAAAALELGFYISFSGILTFPKADSLRAIGEWIPEDRLLVETDCPYLAPVPHRGKRNEPGFVAATAECLSRIRQVSAEHLASATTANFERLFAVKVS